MAKRNDAMRYTPKVTHETATVRSESVKALDYQVGDIVQVRPNGKKYIGRLGMIIGIRYARFDTSGDSLVYTIRFSDKESNDYAASNLSFVRRDR